MDSKNYFDILINGIYKKAKIIDVITYQSQRYAILAIPNKEELCDIYVSKIKRENDGSDKLYNDVDYKVKEHILNMIDECLKEGQVA